MFNVAAVPLPSSALLQTYAARPECYTDCYAVTLPRDIAFEDYVFAFYTTRLFKLERLILRIAAAAPSSDAEARALGRDEADRFAAWTVEGRQNDQILLCDMSSRTRSWLMLRQKAQGNQLLFGSAVVGHLRPDGSSSLGPLFQGLLGFHKVYAQALLASARRSLMR